MVEAPANEFPLQSGNSGGKKDMRSVKRGGKFFVVVSTVLESMCTGTYQKNKKLHSLSHQNVQ